MQIHQSNFLSIENNRKAARQTLTEISLSARQQAYQPNKLTDLVLDNLNRVLSMTIDDNEMAITTFLDIEGALNRNI